MFTEFPYKDISVISEDTALKVLQNGIWAHVDSYTSPLQCHLCVRKVASLRDHFNAFYKK